MGCFESRHAFEKHIEHTYFLPLEKNLGYTDIKAKKFHNILHRYSLSEHMTYSRLLKALTITKVNYKNLESFYKNFIAESFFDYSEKYYQTARLNCLGILLGKGSIETKAEILFQTYDTQAKKILDLNTVLYMLDNLISVAVSLMPEFCLNHDPIAEDLIKYNLYLNIAKNQVLENFFRVFPHPKAGISIKEFTEAFSNKIMAKLFNARDLRLYAYKIAVSMKATDSKLHKYLASETGNVKDSKIDTEELDQYVLKYTSHHPFSKENRSTLSHFVEAIENYQGGFQLDRINEKIVKMHSPMIKSFLIERNSESIEWNEHDLSDSLRPGSQIRNNKNMSVKTRNNRTSQEFETIFTPILKRQKSNSCHQSVRK